MILLRLCSSTGGLRHVEVGLCHMPQTVCGVCLCGPLCFSSVSPKGPVAYCTRSAIEGWPPPHCTTCGGCVPRCVRTVDCVVLGACAPLLGTAYQTTYVHGVWQFNRIGDVVNAALRSQWHFWVATHTAGCGVLLWTLTTVLSRSAISLSLGVAPL